MTTFGPYQATVVDIHDGDTLDVSIVLVANRSRRKIADVDLGFNVHEVSGVGVVLERQSVRLVGCNAAELSTAQVAICRFRTAADHSGVTAALGARHQADLSAM